MTARLQVYKCEVCGNIVLVLHEGRGQLVCCGRPMTLLPEKGKAEEGREKHVPVIGRGPGRVGVKVGSVPHPMEESHYIEWIEVKAGEFVCVKFLRPAQAPEAEFVLEGEPVEARAYCNIHGLWRGSEAD